MDFCWRWDLTVGKRFEIGEGDYTIRFNIENFTDETLAGRSRWFGDAIKERRIFRLELRVKFEDERFYFWAAETSIEGSAAEASITEACGAGGM